MSNNQKKKLIFKVQPKLLKPLSDDVIEKLVNFDVFNPGLDGLRQKIATLEEIAFTKFEENTCAMPMDVSVEDIQATLRRD